jgi:hypothetical protein
VGLPATATGALAVLCAALGVARSWGQPWRVAALAAGACHLLAARPPLTVAFALAFALIAAMPREKAPAATATGASDTAAKTA